MKKLSLKKPDRSQVIRICNLLSLPLQFLGCCALYFVMEVFCRHSVKDAWTYMTGSPLVFLFNAYLIFTTSLLVYLFKNRVLARIIIGTIWLVLGAINGVVLMNRVTPFTGPDLKLLSDAVRIVNKYLSPVAIVGLVIALIALIYFLYRLSKKGWVYQGKIRYYINIPLILVGFLVFSGVTDLALEKRVLSNYFGNIAYAYLDYGFPYCLGVTFFDTGISAPNGYSEELITEIVNSEGEIEATNEENLDVNILFLQLETFIDPTEIEFLEFSEDPVPNFRKLMEEYSSGYYKVPSVGAGTANTEFESISGMSLHYFGAGEYPYKSILKEKTCESMAYVLKDLGYGTHAIHNNEANFYGRKTVFSMLGFDTFTSEEYMPDISDTTPTGWVKDHILTDEIFKAMKSTEGPDYVYTISVQGHGDYPTEPVLDEPVIEVTGAASEELNNAWEYYVNQMYEMDLFIKELTDKLAEFDERVVLVMYGDHLPTMDLKAEDMANRYLFQTKYVMWDNFGMKKKDKNIAAYQMAAEVLDRLDIHEGTIMNYHQTRKGTKNYQIDLEALQYDLLYGEQYAYEGEPAYEKTNMQLGTQPTVFTSIRETGTGGYFISGENFTASARLEVNGELQETKMISENLLVVQNLELQDGDELAVAIQSNSATKKVLTRTETQIYHPLKPEVTPTPEAEDETDAASEAEITPTVSPEPAGEPERE